MTKKNSTKENKTTKKATKTASKSIKKTVAKKSASTKQKDKKVPKKSTPKTAVKKSAKKSTKKTKANTTATKSKTKSTPKKEDNKYLIYATNEESFWVTDGSILNSLLALEQALANMDDEVFGYHVTNDKNDFADWVGVVLCDDKCAADLRKTKSTKSACDAVAKHVKSYSA